MRRTETAVAACLLAVAMALTTSLGGCASTKCTTAECQADAKITANVQALIAPHRDLGPPNQVNVQTIDGVVYLSGQVATDLQRQAAESIAMQAAGVRKVVNNIALTATSR